MLCNFVNSDPEEEEFDIDGFIEAINDITESLNSAVDDIIDDLEENND